MKSGGGSRQKRANTVDLETSDSEQEELLHRTSSVPVLVVSSFPLNLPKEKTATREQRPGREKLSYTVVVGALSCNGDHEAIGRPIVGCHSIFTSAE